ncbi:MAG: hypothetical protein QMC38_06505 [Sinobacterium sp.]
MPNSYKKNALKKPLNTIVVAMAQRKAMAASATVHPEAEMIIVSTNLTGSHQNLPKPQLKAATLGAILKSNLKPR